jgi:hypothetical protein
MCVLILGENLIMDTLFSHPMTGFQDLASQEARKSPSYNPNVHDYELHASITRRMKSEHITKTKSGRDAMTILYNTMHHLEDGNVASGSSQHQLRLCIHENISNIDLLRKDMEELMSENKKMRKEFDCVAEKLDFTRKELDCVRGELDCMRKKNSTEPEDAIIIQNTVNKSPIMIGAIIIVMAMMMRMPREEEHIGKEIELF